MSGDGFDPVELEVLRRQLEGVAEEMGRTLVRGAYSPNIKERRDASTAIFDLDGRLIAQAEHIPVHLGAMPDAVAAVIDARPATGETYLVNDPYAGGSHLPDVTVVGPITADGSRIGYAAARAHWADIGGPVAGGLAGGASSIHEEGMRIPPTPIAEAGDLDEAVVDLLMANIRDDRRRRADLQAQLGAIATGRRRVADLVETHSIDRITTAFDALIEYSRRRTATAIDALADGHSTATDHLEGDGIDDRPVEITAAVTIDGDTIAVDFEGTADQVAGNLNAPPAVAKSAVYFVTRCVTDPDIPPNHGCYEPITIDIPADSLLDPNPPAAVGGGNVETSQRIVDVLVEALRPLVNDLPAHGQGTMNNLVLGFESGDTYYETIGGGAGATPTADGTDGIHVGMTNTRNTPVESLERAFPVLVERYGLREKSGGTGRHRGGWGIERRLRLEAPARLSVLADRRVNGPPGAEGGEPGAVGATEVEGEPIGDKVTIEVAADALIRMLTPGGGGYGSPRTSGDDPTP